MTQQHPPPPRGRQEPWQPHRVRQQASRPGWAAPGPTRQPTPQARSPVVIAARKRRKWPWVVAGVVLLVIAVGNAIGVGSSIPPTPTSLPPGSNPGVPARSPQAPGSLIVYEVTGRGPANKITYLKEGFSQEQQTSATLPFRTELRFAEKVGMGALSLTAQNGSRGGEITCRITVDGEVVNEATSTGQSAVVNCHGKGRSLQ